MRQIPDCPLSEKILVKSSDNEKRRRLTLGAWRSLRCQFLRSLEQTSGLDHFPPRPCQNCPIGS